MPQRTRAQRLNGLFPLSYMGVVPVSPVNFVIDNRPPTVNDYKNFYVGDLWLDVDTNNPPTNEDIWMLVSVASNVATWINFGGGDTETLSGDSGVNPVFPDGADNINVFGDNVAGITVSGDGVNTLTVTTTGILAHDYVTDNGTAIPAAGILNIITNQAGNNAGATFQFSGAGNTVTLNTTDTVLNNTLIGNNAGGSGPITGTGNTGLGEGSLNAITGGIDNCAAGRNSGSNVGLGERNSLFGNFSGQILTDGTDNVVIGYATGPANPSNFNVIIGNAVANSNVGDSNVFIGHNAALLTLNLNRSCYIGRESGAAAVSSDDNVAVGYQSLQNSSSGPNTAVGANALQGAVGASGSGNVALGSFVLRNVTTASNNCFAGGSAGISLTSGSGNSSYGANSLSALVSGDNNCAFGISSGSNYTTNESNNIVICNTGTIGDNDTIRIGTQGSHSRAFMAGITGVNVSNAVAVEIDSVTGQLGVAAPPAAWTPILTFGGATTGITYATQTGSYLIDGKILFFEFDIVLTSKGTATGNASITNLPASLVFGSTAIVQIGQMTLTAGYTYVTGNSSLTAVTLRENDPTGGAFGTLNDTHFANNTSINMSAFGFIN